MFKICSSGAGDRPIRRVVCADWNLAMRLYTFFWIYWDAPVLLLCQLFLFLTVEPFGYKLSYIWSHQFMFHFRLLYRYAQVTNSPRQTPSVASHRAIAMEKSSTDTHETVLSAISRSAHLYQSSCLPTERETSGWNLALANSNSTYLYQLQRITCLLGPCAPLKH